MSIAFVGMGDQFAICDREKDFIFIINSDNQGYSPTTRPILYHELYRTIVSKLGKPIAEDVEAKAELDVYIDNLKLFYLKGNITSNFAEKLDSLTYVLDENPMGIEYMTFVLKGNKGLLKYKNATGVKELPFGFGHNEFSKFPEEDYTDMVATIPEKGNQYECAVSADWSEEKKLRINVQIIDKYFGNFCIECGFKGDEIGVHMIKTFFTGHGWHHLSGRYAF